MFWFFWQMALGRSSLRITLLNALMAAGKKKKQVFLYCLSSALWTHHYWPDCETWQVVSKPPREKTAQRLWTGARRFRQTKSICLHRDPATWTHRYLFVQWVKQHRQYWISEEIPHANIFRLIFADSSGWALGFCAPKCWGEIWPRLEFYIQAYMIPNVRFQREAQWVTLLLRTCVFTGPNLASICVRRGPSGLLLAVGQWVSGRSAAGKCTPSSWTAQQCVMYSPSEDRNGKSVFLKQYCSCSVGRCKDCEKLVARYETYSSLHRHTDMAADRQEAGTDRTASSYSSVSWLDKMCSDTCYCTSSARSSVLLTKRSTTLSVRKSSRTTALRCKAHEQEGSPDYGPEPWIWKRYFKMTLDESSWVRPWSSTVQSNQKN